MAKTKAPVAETKEEVKAVKSAPTPVAPAKEQIKETTKKTVKAAPAKEEKTTEKKKVVESKPTNGAPKASLKSFDVILRPIITEKTMAQLQDKTLNKIAVEANPKSNRTEIKLAFESTYKVKVKAVNVLNVRSKNVRRGKFEGTVPAYKKAIITLAEGEALDLFKEEKK